MAFWHPYFVSVGIDGDAVPERVDDVRPRVVCVEQGALDDASPLARIKGGDVRWPRAFQCVAKRADLFGRPSDASIVNPQVSQVGTVFIIGMQGLVHPFHVVRVPPEGDARKDADSDHQHHGHQAKFRSPQAACQSFVEKG